jgi:hypothetical protein
MFCGTFGHAFPAKNRGLHLNAQQDKGRQKRVFPLPKKFSIFKGKHPLKTIL